MHFKANRTRARIIHSALYVFSIYGKNGTRMADISRRAGVNKAAVYYHFHSKDFLYRTVFMSSLKRVVNKIYSEIQKSVIQHNREEAEIILNRFWDDNPRILKLMIHELISGGQELKSIMTGEDPAVHKTMRKLTGIFALLDKADWHNMQIDEKNLVRRTMGIVAASMSRKLVNTVLASLLPDN